MEAKKTTRNRSTRQGLADSIEFSSQRLNLNQLGTVGAEHPLNFSIENKQGSCYLFHLNPLGKDMKNTRLVHPISARSQKGRRIQMRR
jgi:hypothetical protein